MCAFSFVKNEYLKHTADIADKMTDKMRNRRLSFSMRYALLQSQGQKVKVLYLREQEGIILSTCPKLRP